MVRVSQISRIRPARRRCERRLLRGGLPLPIQPEQRDERNLSRLVGIGEQCLRAHGNGAGK